jgi:hypothetical protein
MIFLLFYSSVCVLFFISGLLLTVSRVAKEVTSYEAECDEAEARDVETEARHSKATIFGLNSQARTRILTSLHGAQCQTFNAWCQ